MCEIMQTCENQNMFHGHQLVMFVGIMVIHLCIFCVLYYVDLCFSSVCNYTSIPQHHYDNFVIAER